MYIYLKTGDTRWTVGFFNPSGVFVGESDWNHHDLAAARVHYLNGGNPNVEFNEEIMKCYRRLSGQ